MNEQEYLLAWGAYAVAALGCLLVWCRMTRWIWRWLREPLRLLVAVLLLTPTIIDPGRELFAPAVAVVALDMVFQIGNNLMRAVADLSMFMVIALAIYVVFAFIRWPLESWWKARRQNDVAHGTASQEDEPTLRELMQRGLEEAEHNAYARGGRVEPRL